MASIEGKRILFVVNEAYFLLSHRSELLRTLVSAGCDVHVAAPQDSVWAPKGFDAQQLEGELGVKFHPISLSRRGQSVVGELILFVDLVRLLRRVSPEILHLLTIKPNLYGGLAARLVGVPAVLFAMTGLGHVFVSNGFLQGLRRRIVILLIGLAFGHRFSRVMLQNTEDLETLKVGGALRQGQALVVPGAGVDLNRFRPIADGEDLDQPIVLLAARLIWEKGVGTFVEAAQLLQRENISAKFVLVGDTNATNPRAVPAEIIQQWVGDGLVEWWGFREAMEKVYSQASVVCLPSTYGEGVPKGLLEAMACGKAVVASDIAGCRQVIDDGFDGTLVPAGDPARLSEAVTELLNDPEKRSRFGQSGRKKAELEFGVDKVVEQTMQLYEELIHFTQVDPCANSSRRRPR